MNDPTTHLPARRAAAGSLVVQGRASDAERKPDPGTQLPWHAPAARLGQVDCLAYAAPTVAAAGGLVACLFDSTTRRLMTRRVETQRIGAIALARDASRLALAAGRMVRVYRLRAGDAGGDTTCTAEPACEYAHEADVTSVCFTPERALVASADTTGAIRLHHRDSGAPVLQAAHHPGGLELFSVDHLLVSDGPTDVRFFDLDTGRLLRTFLHNATQRVPVPRFALGNVLIAYAGSEVRLHDVADEDHCATCFRVLRFGSRVRSVDVSDDQTAFLVATECGEVRIYSLQDARLLAQVQALSRPLLAARFERGRRLLVAGGEGLVTIIENGRHVGALHEGAPIVGAAVRRTPQPEGLLVIDRVGGVTEYGLTTGRRSDRFAGHVASVSVVVTDTRYVCTGSYDGTARVWRHDGAPVAVFGFGRTPIQALALDSRNDRLWVGDFTGAVTCVDIATGQSIASYCAHASSVRSLCLSADGGLLLSGDNDGRLVLRDLAGDGVERWGARVPGTAYRAIFDADGSVLASAMNGVVRFPPGATAPVVLCAGDHVRSFCLLEGDGDAGTRLAALGLAGDLRVHDAVTGACLSHVRLADPRAHRVVLDLGGVVACGSADGVLRFFTHELRPLGELHHLQDGFLWTTEAQGSFPGWVFTDRPDSLDVGCTAGCMTGGLTNGIEHHRWPANDPRVAGHLAVLNSWAHVRRAIGAGCAHDSGLKLLQHARRSGVHVPLLR
jgi:WD40 repeat protein